MMLSGPADETRTPRKNGSNFRLLRQSGGALSTRFILISFLILLTLVGCSRKSSKDELIIGEFDALTGKHAQYGISTRNGIALAIEQANQSGGILGRRIRILVKDDQGEPEKAQAVVSSLITKEHVVAIIGEVASSRTRAAAPVCQQNRIPLISPAATDPLVTQIGNYIFRACFIDSYQGLILAKFVSEGLRLSRIAILRDIRNNYSTGIADSFAERFQRFGGAVVADQKYKEGDVDFTAQLVTIRSVEPQAVIIPGFHKDAARIAIKAREIGLTMPLIGPDAWENPEFISLAGMALKNSYFSAYYSPHQPNKSNRKFVQSYRVRYQTDPDAFAALGFDAAGLLLDAIRRARSAEPARIQNALAQTKSFPGVTGSISLDAYRNPTKPGVIFKYNNGKFEYLKMVAP
jgi:branched-chain amino acid transport system substrate-binding protein